MYISPLFGDSNKPAKCKKVDFPDPDDPTKATIQLLDAKGRLNDVPPSSA